MSRLLLLLESHFGADAITPINTPPSNDPNSETIKHVSTEITATTNGAVKTDTEEADDEKEEETLKDSNSDEGREAKEEKDIPIPGLSIKVDSHEAIIWLDTLEVQCKWKPLEGRVKAVVERGVEVVSGLWG